MNKAELNKFLKWLNDNCYENGGHLRYYGKPVKDLVKEYLAQNLKEDEKNDPMNWTVGQTQFYGIIAAILGFLVGVSLCGMIWSWSTI